MPFLLSRQTSLRFLANLESIITCEGGTRYTEVVHKKGGDDTRRGGGNRLQGGLHADLVVIT